MVEEDWVGVTSTSSRLRTSLLTTLILGEGLLDISKAVNNEIIMIIQAELFFRLATIHSSQRKHPVER